MKTPFLPCAACLLVLAAGSHAHPTIRLGAEWLAPFESSAKQFALVDAASGSVRIAFADGGGTVAWSPTIPTSMSEVSDVTASLFGSHGEILALASASANRVGLIDVERPAPFFRLLSGPPTGLGPQGIAAIGAAPPNRELFLASSENGATPSRIEARSNLSTTTSILSSQNSATLLFRRLQPLSVPGSGTAIGLFTSAIRKETQFGLLSRSGSGFSISARTILSGQVEFATNVRSTHQPTKVFAVSYNRGSSTVRIYEFSTPLNTSSSVTLNSASLPFPCDSILPVRDGGTGPITDGFMATSTDGSGAHWFRINAAGTGLETSTQTFTPSAGKSLAGLIPIPGVSVIALESSTPGSPADSYRALQWNGSSWTQTDAGNLPPLADATSATATLLFYNQDPAIDEDARLLGIQSAGHWTRRSTLPDPLPASVIVESFGSTASGLSPAGLIPVSPAHGTSYVITNQVEPGLSVATLGGAAPLMAPSLRIEPPSGSFRRSFQVTALFDERRYELLYRPSSGGWKLWQGPLPVAWSTNLQFTLRSLSSGVHGPIVSRSYSLPAELLGNLDSDNDGVPDYVEIQLGLDPFSGADFDGDGVSDLDEILGGSSPSNPADTTTSTANIAPGGGMSVVAFARNHSSTEIANREEIEARALDGSLLARAPVGTIAPALPDGGTRGAWLRSSSAPPHDELIALSSPLYFNITSGFRSGRETIGFIPSDPPPAFAPAYTPSGTDLAANATSWITAAATAAASHPAANTRRLIAPADSAVSILLEHLVHSGLSQVRPPADPAPALDRFSFLPGRDLDRSRTTLVPNDRALLRSAGFDFRRALNIATGARSSLNTVANNYYNRFVNGAAATPGMLMPIDALRIVLRGGTPPDGYAPAATAGQLNTARTAYQNALASLQLCFRPQETWLVEIPANPAETGVYHRLPGESAVILLRPDGERFTLEQGLGLRPGTRFNVTGFTDTPADGPYSSMEALAVSLAFEPAASDNDADGNLLDDEWERFFFGATGQDPFSDPHSNGYLLLQYFLDGVDPRSDTPPAGAPVALGLQAPILQSSASPGTAFTLDFLFPAAYQDHFEFVLEASTSLQPGSVTPVPGAIITSLGGDELRATIPASAATQPSTFYRIALRLAGAPTP